MTDDPGHEERGDAAPGHDSDGGGSDFRISRWFPLAGLLSYLADVVARVNVGVLKKLLTGFVLGALLLLGLSILSLVAIDRMGKQVDDLSRLQQTTDNARDMYYLVTAQSHYRAMAILTDDASFNDRIDVAKQAFIRNVDTVDALGGLGQTELIRDLRNTEVRFAEANEQALVLYEAGDMDEVMDFHLSVEHPISHELEAALVKITLEAGDQMAVTRASFERERRLLTVSLWSFAGAGLIAAVVLGIVFSWSFTRPVRRIDFALAKIADGDFTHRINVPNRDEFGALTRNINATSEQLSHLYGELQSLNDNLQIRVGEQVEELERAIRLKRYLSPQLADSILEGAEDVNLSSRRRNLTIFFSDIRGFTALSERVEPEDISDLLNHYLTTMTEIVFKHGGTLDKYIGDAIMVFFGDPIAYDDHVERSVKMALEMRVKLAELQEQWLLQINEPLTVGMGISTGYVTVGNIGSTARMDYTVMGNHVNLASRLADQAKPGQILITDRSLASVRDLVDATEIDQVELQGVSRPIRIYEINEKT